MKLTDVEGRTLVVGKDDKYILVLRSRGEVEEETLNNLYKALHEWYYSPSKFFVLNLPDTIDLEFEKVDE